MSDTQTEALEERKDAEDSPRSSKFWQIALRHAGERDKNWRKRGNKVIERYRGEMGRKEIGGAVTGQRQFNILWSNTETLKGALYARPAKPDVRRRWPDRSPLVVEVATITERALEYVQDRYDEQSTIEAVVEDYLLPGRGVAWVCYDPVVVDDYTDHRIYEDYVFWEDYRESPARRWADVTWVARRHKLTRKQMREHPALEKRAADVPLNWAGDETEEMSDDVKETLKRAEVWEIWDKDERKRVWVSMDMPDIIATEDDPYNLEGFFPCPEPMLSVSTNDSREPIPEFTIYQHQADELDRITERLARLTEALKRRGVYDAEIKELADLAKADDNQFIPSKNFQLLASKGGLAATFQQEDIAPIAQVVVTLYQQRDQLVQTIYEITGISDVIRGATDPNETATAQRLKGQFGSQRLKKRQDRVQRFIRDLYRLKAELMVENMDEVALSEMTGVQLPTNEDKMAAQQAMVAAQQAQQMQQQLPANIQKIVKEAPEILKKPSWEDVMGVLRSDKLRSYRIDIETDSTAFEDEQAEKQARTEYITAVGGFMQSLLPIAQASPSMAKLGLEMLGFMSRGYKVGRQLEDSIDEATEGAVKEMQQAMQAAQQQGPDPKMVEAEQKMKIEAAKLENNQNIEQAKLSMDAQKSKAELDMKREEIAAQIQLQREKAASEIAVKREIEILKLEQQGQIEQAKAMRSDMEREISAVRSGNDDTAAAIAEQFAESMQAIMDGLNAPKRVVRDETGQIAGVEPV